MVVRLGVNLLLYQKGLVAGVIACLMRPIGVETRRKGGVNYDY